MTKARLSSRCLFIGNATPRRPDIKLASLMLAVPGCTGLLECVLVIPPFIYLATKLQLLSVLLLVK